MRTWCSKAFRSATTLLLLLPGALTGAQPTEAQMAIERLVEFGAAAVTEKVERNLANSGLAPQEVDRIASEATVGFARCLVGALVELDDPRSRQLLSLLAKATKAQDIEEAFVAADPTDYPDAKANLDSHTVNCASTVIQELGLSGIDDAT